MFKKNSMKFSVVLNYYLYYSTVAVLLWVHSHMSFQNVLWSPDLVTWYDYLNSHIYLYLYPIVYFEVIDQVFKCVGSYFLFGALITVVIENNNLVTHKLANLYCVINVDGTPNKVGQITEHIWAYVEIGFYKTTQYLFVTNLGNKEMMIGYLYLYKHNTNIDWQKDQ